MKREAGENPARSRHCNRGVTFCKSLIEMIGKIEANDDPRVRRPAYFNNTVSCTYGE